MHWWYLSVMLLKYLYTHKHAQMCTAWALYLLHSCTQNVISFVEGHLNRAQELQPVSVHPLTALYCTEKKERQGIRAKTLEIILKSNIEHNML